MLIGMFRVADSVPLVTLIVAEPEVVAVDEAVKFRKMELLTNELKGTSNTLTPLGSPDTDPVTNPVAVEPTPSTYNLTCCEVPGKRVRLGGDERRVIVGVTWIESVNWACADTNAPEQATVGLEVPLRVPLTASN